MESLRTLPTDDVRAIMWRFSDRYDLQMLVQSARAVARGPVAKAVSEGGRNTHEWTEKKASLLKAYDEAGITSFFMEPQYGGYIEGPKNLASALVAYELAWVDGGAATCSLAGNLALEPIHERGTSEQKKKYLSAAVPPQPGESRKHLRGAFSLTEPIPYVGVETGILCGKMRVVEWEEGKEPILQVEKRGRFITNMDFANFSTVAVDTDDPKIKTSCMIIIEESDPGVFDRGAPVLKLVHQLSSTRDPIFAIRVPASRIIGGYTVKDGVIIPNHDHGDVIGAVFKRTRVTVGLMTAAKLLSSIEPVIRYQRTRFRGGVAQAGNPRFELGIQQKEDSVQRLAAIAGMGEAAASLGFAAARVFDELDVVEKKKDEVLAAKGSKGGRAELRVLMQTQKEALELYKKGDWDGIKADPLTDFVVTDSIANVLCPACKLWNTGQGATTMREAVSLMGGYGITEDCPGFLGQKWMDAQLEATYEGPEAVQRRQLSVTMTNPLFLAQMETWIKELEGIAAKTCNVGAGLIVAASRLWLHTLNYLQNSSDAAGTKLFSSSRQGVSFPMADALCWLLASRYQILDALELANKGAENPMIAEGLEGLKNYFFDLCHTQAARAASEVLGICCDQFYGYRLEATPTEEQTKKFGELTQKLQGKYLGVGLARDRAANALTQVMIPEALDYPV